MAGHSPWANIKHRKAAVDAKRGKLWTGLAELFPPADEQPDIQDCKDRMLFIESIETVRCFDEGVLNSTAEANIGSIFGIGFPANTGGAAQFINGYEGPEGTGTAAFVARARELAAKYGERFEDSEGKQIFMEFADEEKQHLELLIREYKSLVSRKGRRRPARSVKARQRAHR